ncbi:MAG: hypothetical protein EOQ98_31410 [Mesorhizobium sp.]|uniref:hypothetical protein n=1 Tax=Mesorhizobium sp. TaxID=1871066 RepID=UPI000FE943BB|nr:hypothetical protein [Mesorhizobium sp.]RWO94296.1 MAG: hypothetical protein EOQ98_31410 [Mesorhizobium sp.]
MNAEDVGLVVARLSGDADAKPGQVMSFDLRGCCSPLRRTGAAPELALELRFRLAENLILHAMHDNVHLRAVARVMISD